MHVPHVGQLQRGVSLIEVLIAMFVLAVGLLGMAGLQAMTVRATADSGNVGRASRLAYDMVDRIRLEIDPTLVNAYVTAAASDQTGTSSAACYGSSGCTGTTRATAEVAEWQRLLAAGLPSGEGIVCRYSSPLDGTARTSAACSGNAADPVVVKVWWQAHDLQQQSGSGLATQRVVLVVGP
jgi:type IV pilus assembly protein PilV